MANSKEEPKIEAGRGTPKKGALRRFLDWLARGGESYAATGCGQ